MKTFIRYYFFVHLLFVASFSACQEYNSKGKTSISLSKPFAKAKNYGSIEYEAIKEASGLACSKSMTEKIWTHNDSGDKARVFLMNEKGRHICEFELEGVKARDWEDIATCYDPRDKNCYLYIAEIGDNKARYEKKHIYKLVEPKPNGDKKKIISQSDFETITFEFPDGKRDAETLMIDPLTQDIYIVSKREEKVNVYVLAADIIKKNQTNVPRKVATLPFHNANAGDISANGQEILIKTYDNIYYWKRQKNESIAEALRRNATKLDYNPEPQGESVAWKSDGSGFFTTSEEVAGQEAVLLFYKRQK